MTDDLIFTSPATPLRGEQRAMVQSLLAMLTPVHWGILMLRIVVGLSSAETAVITGLSASETTSPDGRCRTETGWKPEPADTSHCDRYHYRELQWRP
jgi:DNA-directed RNA polymerase specialized sigma24 family protein